MQVCNRFNEPEILTNPEKYFGPNYKILINYWIYKNDVYPEQLRLLNDTDVYFIAYTFHKTHRLLRFE
jgi:hypothetical protein